MSENEDEKPNFAELLDTELKKIDPNQIGYYAVWSKKRQKNGKVYTDSVAKEVHFEKEVADKIMKSLSKFVSGAKKGTEFKKYTEIDEPKSHIMEYIPKSEVSYSGNLINSIESTQSFLNSKDLNNKHNLGFAVKFSEELIGIGGIQRRNVLKSRNGLLTRFKGSSPEVTLTEMSDETFLELETNFPIVIIKDHMLITDESQFENLFVYNEKLAKQLDSELKRVKSLISDSSGLISKVGNNRLMLKSLVLGLPDVDPSKFTGKYIKDKSKKFNLDIKMDKNGKIDEANSNTWHLIQLLTDRIYEGETTGEKYKVHTREKVPK